MKIGLTFLSTPVLKKLRSRLVLEDSHLNALYQKKSLKNRNADIKGLLYFGEEEVSDRSVNNSKQTPVRSIGWDSFQRRGFSMVELDIISDTGSLKFFAESVWEMIKFSRNFSRILLKMLKKVSDQNLLLLCYLAIEKNVPSFWTTVI